MMRVREVDVMDLDRTTLMLCYCKLCCIQLCSDMKYNPIYCSPPLSPLLPPPPPASVANLLFNVTVDTSKERLWSSSPVA